MPLELSDLTSSGLTVYPPGATFGPRQLSDHEFVWLIEGDADYRWGAKTVHATQGAILLCRPRQVDSFRWDPDRPTRHAFFHFSILDLPPDWPAPETWPLVRQPPDGDILRPMFRHILTWAEDGDAALRQAGMAHLLQAFVLGEISTRDVPVERLPEAVERALGLIRSAIERDPKSALALRALAEVACVTPEHLCRSFKRALGLSPLEAVRLARLDRAAVLLARSNFDVRQIADLCGFASPFHFSRRFKQAYGASPTALRQAIAEGATPPTPRLMVTRPFSRP